MLSMSSVSPWFNPPSFSVCFASFVVSTTIFPMSKSGKRKSKSGNTPRLRSPGARAQTAARECEWVQGFLDFRLPGVISGDDNIRINQYHRCSRTMSGSWAEEAQLAIPLAKTIAFSATGFQ
jgi:hypothetical protein